MMEALGALGLACNVFQLIETGQKVVACCKRIYDSGSPEPELEQIGASLATLALQVAVQNGSQGSRSARKQELVEVAKSCVDAATALQHELQRCLALGTGFRARLGAATKSMWAKTKVERAEKVLKSAQRNLETHLLARIWYVM